jgi:nucleotide-binding universal stress UspA family protein
LPVDGSLSMTPLVHKCLAFAAGIHASVVAVHVARSPGADEAGPAAPDTPATADAALAGRILQEVADAARMLGVPCDCRVLNGAEPWRAIVRAGAEFGVDLICMGSHGRHGAAEHVLASQAARVLEHTQLPVLLFR